MEKDGFYLLSNENDFGKQFHHCSPAVTNVCARYLGKICHRKSSQTPLYKLLEICQQHWAPTVISPEGIDHTVWPIGTTGFMAESPMDFPVRGLMKPRISMSSVLFSPIALPPKTHILTSTVIPFIFCSSRLLLLYPSVVFTIGDEQCTSPKTRFSCDAKWTSCLASRWIN